MAVRRPEIKMEFGSNKTKNGHPFGLFVAISVYLLGSSCTYLSVCVCVWLAVSLFVFSRIYDYVWLIEQQYKKAMGTNNNFISLTLI